MCTEFHGRHSADIYQFVCTNKAAAFCLHACMHACVKLPPWSTGNGLYRGTLKWCRSASVTLTFKAVCQKQTLTVARISHTLQGTRSPRRDFIHSHCKHVGAGGAAAHVQLPCGCLVEVWQPVCSMHTEVMHVCCHHHLLLVLVLTVTCRLTKREPGASEDAQMSV